MPYLRQPPAPPLAAFVDCLWYFEGRRATRELALPTGTTELVIDLRQERIRVFSDVEDTRGQELGAGIVCGPHSRYFVLDAAAESAVLGVHFRPGGAAAFLGAPLSELGDSHVGLEDLWGARAGALRERLLEAGSPAERLAVMQEALLSRLAGSQAVHPVVPFALRHFAGSPEVARVGEVAGATGYSTKRFIRLFEEGVGLTPKRFCRVLRLQAVLQSLARGLRIEWAEVAAASGYCDQSHLIRDFRAMTGVTPARYRPVDEKSINHVALEN
jgi:AraC-like DNA-binding protein